MGIEAPRVVDLAAGNQQTHSGSLPNMLGAMARRPSKHLRPARPLSTSFARADQKSDGAWMVQNVTVDRAIKEYLCPGCSRRIPVGVAHLVAWPRVPSLGLSSGVDERRHWHTACWNRRH